MPIAPGANAVAEPTAWSPPDPHCALKFSDGVFSIAPVKAKLARSSVRGKRMARLWALATVCFSLLATESRAQVNDGAATAESPAAAPAPKTIVGPPWVRRPGGLDVQAVFPGAAVRARQYAGDVTVECKVAKDGGLTSCVVLEETPQGFGFGRAGLKLTRQFKMKAKTADGYPTVGGTVRIPIMLRAPR